MTMIIYYNQAKVAMTCNYSAKNSSVIYYTYHNFVRFAIIQDRIPFPQFVLDCPSSRSVFLDFYRYKKALSEEGFVTHPLRGQITFTPRPFGKGISPESHHAASASGVSVVTTQNNIPEI